MPRDLKSKPRKKCHFYMKDGRCKHLDAPNPSHSWCVGTVRCGVYEVTVFEEESGHQSA